MSLGTTLLRRARRFAGLGDARTDGGGPVLFAFTGGSASWPAMGRTRYARSRAFRDAIDEAATVVDEILGWNAAAHFRGIDEPAESLAVARRNDIIRLGLLQLAQVDLWRGEGVVPDGVVSVSLGEMVAPYAAGAISRGDCARILAVVAQAISRTPSDNDMFLLEVDGPEAERLCRSSPVPLDYLGSVTHVCAAVLCRRADAPSARVHLDGRILRTLATDWNYHMPRLDVDRAWMQGQLAGVRPQLPATPIYSSVAGGRITRAPAFDAAFFAWMVSRPFRFGDAVSAALADGFRTIINIGPHPANSAHLSAIAAAGGHPIRLIDTMTTNDEEGTWDRARRAVRSLVRSPIASRTFSAATLELKDPAVEARLFDAYEALRAAGTPLFLATNGSWIVLDFDSVQRALSQPALFSSRTAIMEEADPVLLGSDPPAHTAVRRLLARHFSKEAIARRVTLAERTANRLLEPLRAGRPIDAVAEFATPLAQDVAADLVGLPSDVVRRVDDCTLAARGDMRSVYERVHAPLQEAAPHSRLYGELLGDRDGALDAAAACSLVRLLWVTATTPKRVLGSAILLLLEHPEIRAALQARPELLGAFVDEVIRLRPAEHLIPRVTTADVELRGVMIPRGARVLLCVAAANRDPSAFPDPSAIHLTGRTTGHVSFGAGIHRCLGAALGSAVILTGLRALLREAPQFSAAQPLSTVRYAPGASFRELEQLVIAR